MTLRKKPKHESRPKLARRIPLPSAGKRQQTTKDFFHEPCPLPTDCRLHPA
ncbi:MAG: hypothetical protein AB1486_06190 [Planctomycetota bacterium]